MKAERGQTLIDMAIRQCGSATAAWELAVAGGVSVTDAIEGCEVADGVGVVRRQVVAHYQRQNVKPAGGLCEGIGGWSVGVFTVM